MNYISDTHSLVWYFTDDLRLSRKAFEAFENCIKEGTIIIPTIVLAELMFIADKGKISLSFEETLDKIEYYKNFQIAPLDIDILKIANKIKISLEMHDKLIIATTIYLGATLITKDKHIRNSGLCSTIW